MDINKFITIFQIILYFPCLFFLMNQSVPSADCEGFSFLRAFGGVAF